MSMAALTFECSDSNSSYQVCPGIEEPDRNRDLSQALGHHVL
jgi:hypothetical protein